MMPARLQEIGFVFPSAGVGADAFWSALVRILGAIPQADLQVDRIVIGSAQPKGALPVTSFQRADVARPQLMFTPDGPVERTIGGLHLGQSQPPQRVETSGAFAPSQLSLADVAEQVAGHVTRLDHAGLNVSPAVLSRAEWERMVQHCAASAAVYRYPGEDWPFIVPATAAELADDIREFVPGREPKFEFVYDRWPDEPVLQFSVDTDLTRAELEARFPAPEGQTLPGLEDIFRTVYVAHPWPGLILRCDLTYRADNGVSDWATGEWLVTQGGRLRPT